MIPTVAYIHGAGSTSRSFSWLYDKLPPHRPHKFDYTIMDTALSVTEKVIEWLDDQREPVALVGHSLGGLIAVCAAQAMSHKVAKVVTLSSPFGGSMMADFLSWLAIPSPVFDDVRPSSAFLQAVLSNQLHCPVLSFVTTSGMPHIHTENDGVVTVRSQMTHRKPEYVKINVNHFEVLMHAEVSARIGRFLSDDPEVALVDDAADTDGGG